MGNLSFNTRSVPTKNMTIINEKPRPRALFLGFEPKEIDPYKKFFPTTKCISHLDEVRQAEWDILLTKDVVEAPASHMYILSFGDNIIGGIDYSRGPQHSLGLAGLYDEQNYSLATEFLIPEELDKNITRLLERDLIPKLKDRTPHSCLSTGILHNIKDKILVHDKEDVSETMGLEFQLFIGTPEPKALAGSFTRQEEQAQVWMLPYSDVDIAAWIELALRQWHKTDPGRFPVNLGWERSPEWMTPAETNLASKIEAVRNERQETTARLNKLEQDLATQLHTASVTADSDERLLLTAQGDPLVQAVIKAFVELGFHVQDMDKVFPPNDRREDLRIRLSEEEPWVAICEVKGYYKGAQVNDLLKIERFRGRFFKETRRDPDRCWYVTNHHSKDNPSTRGSPLPMNAEEVATFSDSGGLVISTVALFQLVMQVRRGILDAKAARDLLMNHTGLLSLKAEHKQH